jgi:hypothetical protein
MDRLVRFRPMGIALTNTGRHLQPEPNDHRIYGKTSLEAARANGSDLSGRVCRPPAKQIGTHPADRVEVIHARRAPMGVRCG